MLLCHIWEAGHWARYTFALTVYGYSSTSEKIHRNNENREGESSKEGYKHLQGLESKSWFDTLPAQLIQLTDKKLRRSSSSEYRYLHTGIWNQGESLGLITKVKDGSRQVQMENRAELPNWVIIQWITFWEKKKKWTTVTRKIMVIWNHFFCHVSDSCCCIQGCSWSWVWKLRIYKFFILC